MNLRSIVDSDLGHQEYLTQSWKLEDDETCDRNNQLWYRQSLWTDKVGLKQWHYGSLWVSVSDYQSVRVVSVVASPYRHPLGPNKKLGLGLSRGRLAPSQDLFLEDNLKATLLYTDQQI